MGTQSYSFLDEAIIDVESGKGGDGCLSFRREKYVPRGGPDGGDGGKGGHLVLIANENVNTLLKIARQHHYKAEDGRHGMNQRKYGRGGEDLYVHVPVGTLVYDADTDMLLRDLKSHKEEVIACHGGKGGKGNVHFASSTNQTPQEFTCGQDGIVKTLKLELKLMADVGLVGLPNAGKSTMLNRLSAARPKIGAYPFTTLNPSLGMVEINPNETVVMADIPGLIEGASDGVGLGIQFLKHIERCKIILHLVDIMPVDGSDPVENYHVIRAELNNYSSKLSSKQEIIVANKIDLIPDTEAIDAFAKKLGKPVVGFSGIAGLGKKDLFIAISQSITPPEDQDNQYSF